MSNISTHYDAICIGAGPAGLTAAYLLAKAGKKVGVMEMDPVYVGGISRTESNGGYLIDIGGHRFFSKSREVEALWDELLDHKLLLRPRKSRIFYKGKFFAYPLQAFDALMKLGVMESTLCVLSYIKTRIFPVASPATFEQWVSNQFGYRLFSIFFRTYTEKVWGMKCSEISSDWAAQRIKGLSLFKAILNSLPFAGAVTSKGVVKTLIDKFRYPERGPGMMWEAAASKIKAMGGDVMMGTRATRCVRNGPLWEVTFQQADKTFSVHAEHVISSMPLSTLVAGLSPSVPAEVLGAAKALKYRDFLIVGMVVKERSVFDDNWIYIHDPAVKVGRIQNFKSWSPAMVPDPSTNCYGLEYFCFEDDALWKMPDGDLVSLARKELAQLGLAVPEDIMRGFVVRQKKAYPVYDADYKRHVNVIREYVDSIPGLHVIGRNGMHRYNNQDHSMMTAMLTAKNILAGDKLYDIWNVNEDAEYHEEDRKIPVLPDRLVPQEALSYPMDGLAEVVQAYLLRWAPEKYTLRLL